MIHVGAPLFAKDDSSQAFVERPGSGLDRRLNAVSGAQGRHRVDSALYLWQFIVNDPSAAENFQLALSADLEEAAL